MIIMIIIFKGIVIEIIMEYLETREHNKHKTPHNLNSRLKRKSYKLMCGPPLLYSLSIQITLSWVGGVHFRPAYRRRGTKN